MQNASEAGAETPISAPPTPKKPDLQSSPPAAKADPSPQASPLPKEMGGPTGPEPTRYGDWEKKGRCIDF